MDLLLNFIVENIFFVAWITFSLIIFVLAYFNIKSNSLSIILGMMISYMLLFPFSRRILIFLTIDVANLRSVEFAGILLVFFICLLLYVLLKQFFPFFKENPIMENFSYLINEGYKAIFDFFGKFEIFEDFFLNPTIRFLRKNINSNEKILFLYFIFNIIPKSMFFSSLFYDINVLQHLHYSLYGSILLIFPLIFNFCFKMIKLYTKAVVEELSTYIHCIEDDFEKEEIDALLNANLNPEKHNGIAIHLIRPPLEHITEEWFAYKCIEIFYRIHGWRFWCYCVEEFINNVIYFRSTVIFLIIQILCQLTTIINQL